MIKLTEKKLSKIIKEEVHKVLSEKRGVRYTLAAENVGIFKEVLNRAKLDNVLQRLEPKSASGPITISLSKKESNLIGKVINEMLNVSRIGYNSEPEQRKLQKLLDNLPYLDTFSKF